MQITFFTRKFRNVQCNLHCDIVHITTKWIFRLTLDCNGVFAIKAYWNQAIRLWHFVYRLWIKSTVREGCHCNAIMDTPKCWSKRGWNSACPEFRETRKKYQLLWIIIWKPMQKFILGRRMQDLTSSSTQSSTLLTEISYLYHTHIGHSSVTTSFFFPGNLITSPPCNCNNIAHTPL